ncbi:lipoprotein [Pectobacterium brasiliense]|uniref:lipoprotein n=1 Tax=Pectobacterium brasiliense TaxID=180957 RepID=UPI0032EDD87E
MKKSGWMAAAAVLLAFTLSGCNKLTQYTLSEQEVNEYLQKHNDYQKRLGVPGVVDAHIVLTELSSQIGRAEPGKVTLTGNAKVDISSLLGNQAADMKLTLKAQPVFDKAQGAIYLKDMELVDYTVQPEKMQAVMKTLSPYLNQSLKSYFDQKPAYVLNADKSTTESMAKKMAKGIEIKPGQIVILFTD